MQLRFLAWPLFVVISHAAPLAYAEPAPVTARAATPTPAQPQAAEAARLLQDDRALARWVIEHSPEVGASRAELDAARAAQRGSRLFPNPVVELSVNNFALGDTNPRGLSRDKTLLYGVGVSEMVELGKRGPRIAAAGLRERAAQSRLSANVAERVAQARLALAQLVYARTRAGQLDASLAEARAAAQVAKGRLDHQALSGVDYDRLVIDLSTIETESAHAHADAEAAEAQCTAIMLSPCTTAAADLSALGPAASVPSSWQPKQLAERSDIRALTLEGSAATRDADLASARAIPDLTFRLGYAHDVFTIAGNISDSLSLSVSCPIPVSDRGQHAHAEALAHAAQYSRLARGTLVRAQGDVTALYTRKRALEGALERIQQDSLPRANGVLEAEERGLREGQLDITDLLLVRREAIALRLHALDLHFELFTVRNELRQALGLDEALAQR